MKFKRAALSCVILAGVGALVAGGCGFITAPVSVPKAIGENTFFSISGPIVDVNGKSIEHVIVSQERNHRLWEPMLGSTTNNYETRVRTFNGNYESNERGNELELKFTHDDFKETKITLKNDSKVITTPLGDWPLNKKFPVVMFGKNEKDVPLPTDIREMDLSKYPTQGVINISVDSFGDSQRDVETANIPAGSFYLTLKKQQPTPINSKGDVDPIEINLPGELVLHIGKSAGEFGFVPIAPRLGFPPLQTMDEAPATGYKPELTISRARLKEMRAASPRDLQGAYEYFYFKANDVYGKGCIRWSLFQRNYSSEPVQFHVELFKQTKANQRDLTSRGLVMSIGN